jgi:dimethylargininase
VRVRDAVVRPPAHNFGDGITAAKLGAPDLDKARTQHAAYCDALRAAGANVITLEPDARNPDAAFVEDTAVLIAGRAVLTRPGAESRRNETVAMRRVLAQFFDAVDEIEAPGTLDGGDVCEASDRVYIGMSHRTNYAGATQLGALLAKAGKTPRIIDIRNLTGILHLKSGMSYLGDGSFVANDALAPILEEGVDRIIRVAPEEAYGANCVRINGTILLAAGHPHLEAEMRHAGLATVALNVSEFRKMDGGLSCLSLRF